MVSTNNFKTGMTIEYEGNIYQVIEFQHVNPGKGAAFVRTRLKNLRTGSTIDHTFKSDEKMPQAMIDKITMQYLYDDGDALAFMDMETFIQMDIPKERLVDEISYLVEGMNVIVIKYQEELLGVLLPDKVTLKVIQTPPGVKGNTAANATKDAILETKLVVQVPLFVNEGDSIIVNTNDGKYNSRA